MAKAKGKVEAKVAEVRVEEVAKPPVVCEVCGKTFRDHRGLNGHMAGKHGKKWGVNATLDILMWEMAGVRVELASLKEAMDKRYVEGQRCLDLAEEVLQMDEAGRCDWGKNRANLRQEINRLRGLKG